MACDFLALVAIGAKCQTLQKPIVAGCGQVAFGSLVAALAVVEKITHRVPRHGTQHHLPQHPPPLPSWQLPNKPSHQKPVGIQSTPR